MRLTAILCFCCISFLPAFAQVLPPAYVHDWSAALYNEMPQGPLQVIDIMSTGGINDSSADNSAALDTAIAWLNGQPGIVHFPAGKYLFKSPKVLPEGIVLRGEGADSTQIYFDLNGAAADCFRMSGNAPGNFTPVTAGYTKGSHWIKVTDTTGLSVTGFAEIRETNGSWDSNPASWATYSVGQLLFIDTIIGDTVYLVYPLRIDYDSLLMPEIRPMDLQKWNGFGCFYMERIDEPVSGAGYNFLFDRCVFGYMQGVYSHKSVGSHVMLEMSSNVKISGCYFYDAFTFDGSGTRGYGVTINNHAGQCLVENNVFRRLRHAMMVKHGANGNVFGYNYSIEPNRSEPIANYSGDISLHGHYAYANLFEGNIVQNIMTDHYWGPSGPDNVFLRNRAELFGILVTTGPVQTEHQAYIGNETTNSGLFMGQYSIPGNNHFSYGNNILGNTIPAGTSQLNDTSYYRNGIPAFWYINDAYPSVGYPNSLGSLSNPAKQRYGINHFILCDETELGFPTLETPTTDQDNILLYPNPSDGQFFINADVSDLQVTIWNVLGGQVPFLQNGGIFQLTDAAPGLYIVRIKTGTKEIHKKLILERR